MALETLKGIQAIGDWEILNKRPTKADGSINWSLFDEQRKSKPIYIDHDVNMISFRIQNGPVKEVGINGCQVDTIIETAKIMLEGLHAKFPCDDNIVAITCLDTALMALKDRKKDRERRGVEGFDKE